MNVGRYCKNYRVKSRRALAQLIGDASLQAVYAFEDGRSTNLNHLTHYVKLAVEREEEDKFMQGLWEVLKHG